MNDERIDETHVELAADVSVAFALDKNPLVERKSD
jgi:hypothetical protein